MTWTTIPTKVTSDPYTASMWNVFNRDNMNHLLNRVRPLPFIFWGQSGGSQTDIGVGYELMYDIVGGSNNRRQQFSTVLPSDFVSLDMLSLFLAAGSASGTFTYDLEVGYGAPGEIWYNHNNTQTGLTIGTTGNQVVEVDISAYVTTPAAGDVLGVLFEGDNTSPTTSHWMVGILGLYIGG